MILNIPEINSKITLEKDWTFSLLYTHHNDAILKALGEVYNYRSPYLDKEFQKLTLPKGTVLVVKRLYVRAGSSQPYDSITFCIHNCTVLPKGTRFFAPLHQCNGLEYSVPKKQWRLQGDKNDITSSCWNLDEVGTDYYTNPLKGQLINPDPVTKQYLIKGYGVNHGISLSQTVDLTLIVDQSPTDYKFTIKRDVAAELIDADQYNAQCVKIAKMPNWQSKPNVPTFQQGVTAQVVINYTVTDSSGACVGTFKSLRSAKDGIKKYVPSILDSVQN